MHVKIEGRVQGVGYRAWTVAVAHQHGIKGWVRNRTDGSVEAVFAGSEAAVEMMLQDCYDGPQAAKITSIQVSDYNGAVDEGFTSKPTV